MAELTEDVIRELYSVSPEEFVYKRAELADRARKKGDGAIALAIDKLRKPTAGAWIVNAFVLDDPSVVDRLTELGDRLRAAQDALDAGLLRELSVERRSLVAGLCGDAFGRAGRKQPPAGLRDEVRETFDAAIADPEVAARLGRLQRAEHWSGFGFLPAGGPALTLVQGGRDQPAPKGGPARNAPEKPSAPKQTAAEKRRLQRTLATAKDSFERADAAFTAAQDGERELGQEVRRLGKQLAKLQQRLDDARAGLERVRKDVTAARAKRREARSALDKAERDAPG